MTLSPRAHLKALEARKCFLRESVMAVRFRNPTPTSIDTTSKAACINVTHQSCAARYLTQK